MFSFLRQLTTWLCSQSQLSAGRAAIDRCLPPAGPTAANPPQRQRNVKLNRDTAFETKHVEWIFTRSRNAHEKLCRLMFYAYICNWDNRLSWYLWRLTCQIKYTELRIAKNRAWWTMLDHKIWRFDSPSQSYDNTNFLLPFRSAWKRQFLPPILRFCENLTSKTGSNIKRHEWSCLAFFDLCPVTVVDIRQTDRASFVRIPVSQCATNLYSHELGVGK